jgi:hypothetical protein
MFKEDPVAIDRNFEAQFMKVKNKNKAFIRKV